MWFLICVLRDFPGCDSVNITFSSLHALWSSPVYLAIEEALLNVEYFTPSNLEWNQGQDMLLKVMNSEFYHDAKFENAWHLIEVLKKYKTNLHCNPFSFAQISYKTFLENGIKSGAGFTHRSKFTPKMNVMCSFQGMILGADAFGNSVSLFPACSITVGAHSQV